MAELVDAQALGVCAARRGGSIPLPDTMKKRIVTSILIILVVVAGYLKFRPRSLKEKYALAPVTREDIRQTVTASGKIKSAVQVDLKFQTSGLLAWVGVKEGDSVKKWQAVAGLDRRVLQKDLQKYLLDFSKERADFDEDIKITYRDRALTDTISRILQKNQFDLDKAVLDVEIQDIALKLATLVSPINGIITKAEPPVAGVNVTPTTAVFTVADPARLLFEAEIDEADIGEIEIGQPAELFLDAFPDEPISLSVSRIDFNATVDSSGATVYQTEFTLENTAKLRLGLNGEITVTTAWKNRVLTVPFSSVDSNNQVRVVRDGRIESVTVETGAASDERLEIISGLNEGELVVL